MFENSFRREKPAHPLRITAPEYVLSYWSKTKEEKGEEEMKIKVKKKKRKGERK